MYHKKYRASLSQFLKSYVFDIYLDYSDLLQHLLDAHETDLSSLTDLSSSQLLHFYHISEIYLFDTEKLDFLGNISTLLMPLIQHDGTTNLLHNLKYIIEVSCLARGLLTAADISMCRAHAEDCCPPLTPQRVAYLSGRGVQGVQQFLRK